MLNNNKALQTILQTVIAQFSLNFAKWSRISSIKVGICTKKSKVLWSNQSHLTSHIHSQSYYVIGITRLKTYNFLFWSTENNFKIFFAQINIESCFLCVDEWCLLSMIVYLFTCHSQDVCLTLTTQHWATLPAQHWLHCCCTLQHSLTAARTSSTQARWTQDL